MHIIILYYAYVCILATLVVVLEYYERTMYELVFRVWEGGGIPEADYIIIIIPSIHSTL